ncbi:MAG: hypothetical protein AAF702_50820 [Chloroflexota bacterium]
MQALSNLYLAPFENERTVRWLIPFGALLTLFGYFGPWVDHNAAALVVTGLDLGEYVKFLVPVRNGTISLWREGFYLPLATVSLTLSLFAFRGECGYNWIVRFLLLLIAWVASLNMLPPAWSPSRLMTDEFRLQSGAIGVCLAASLVSPLLALFPIRLSLSIVSLLGIGAMLFPIRNFWRILPTIGTLYQNNIVAGWGLYVMALGLIILIGGCWAIAERRR